MRVLSLCSVMLLLAALGCHEGSHARDDGPYGPGRGPLPHIGAHGPAVPRAWVPLESPRNWQYIIIHHSASDGGNALAFHSMHTGKGWDELGYHFVIGNGTRSDDGEVEVGSRWARQKWGAHTKAGDGRYNLYGIGICLVGNFEDAYPTDLQWQSLVRLVAFMMDRYGVPPEHVLGHRDCKPTLCPGKHLDLERLRCEAVDLLKQSR